MKFKLILGLLLLAAACQTANTGVYDEVTNFQECVEAGNPIMESYPMQCRHGDEVFVEEVGADETPTGQRHYCTEEEKAAEICTMDYIPVCGDDGKTYSNGCAACAAGIDSYVPGECAVLADSQEKLIGGDKDDHGCLIGAGYSYDAQIGACIRIWELDESQRTAAKTAVEMQNQDVLTVVSVDVLRCPGCFDVTLQAPEGNPFIVELRQN